MTSKVSHGSGQSWAWNGVCWCSALGAERGFSALRAWEVCADEPGELESQCPGCFFQMLVPCEASSVERAGPPPARQPWRQVPDKGRCCLEGVIAETASGFMGLAEL